MQRLDLTGTGTEALSWICRLIFFSHSNPCSLSAPWARVNNEGQRNSDSAKGITFARHICDLCIDQRSWGRGYDYSLPLLFRFLSIAAFLLEQIHCIISILSCKHKTFRYSVQPGTFSIGWTIFWVAFGGFTVVLAWECNHVISSFTEAE